jgi:hypothetical protein
MNHLRKAIAGAMKSVQRLGGECVLYTCGKAGETADIKAILGKTQFDNMDEDNNLIRWESIDFIIQVCDFWNDREPQRGDTIVYDNQVYAVMPDDGLPCFAYMDPTHVMYRIHTKRIEDC